MIKEYLSIKPKIWRSLYSLFRARNPQSSKEDVATQIAALLEKDFKFAPDLAQEISPRVYDLLSHATKAIDEACSKEAQKQADLEDKGALEDPVVFYLSVSPVDMERMSAIYTPPKEIEESESFYINGKIDRLRFTSQDVANISEKIVALFADDPQIIPLINEYKTLANTAVDGVNMTFPQLKHSLTQIAHKLKRHEKFRIALLLTALVGYCRYNAHPSYWIHYKKDVIFFVAGLSKLSQQEKNVLTQFIHFNYQMDMQVIGSTNPIPCYKLPWLADQPTPGTDDNPFLDVGPFDHESLFNSVLYFATWNDDEIEE